MGVTDAEYERAVQACVAACAKWQAEHPDARLRFRPLIIPPPRPGLRVGGMIAGLDQALELGVAGNSLTRKLLTAIDRATPNGGATVLMAEFAIEQVYGIQRALTRAKN